MASSLGQIPYQNRDQVLACKPCAETWFSFEVSKYNWSFKLLPVNTRKRRKIMAFLYSTCLYVSISCFEIKVGYEYRSSVKYVHLISAHSNIDSCVKKGFEERKRNGRYSDPCLDYLTLDCYCSCSSFKAKKIKEDYSITRLHP